uniref:Uncharacterized protein n=1 Tax=Mus musculus TaxID=10090 RepID=Q3U4S2_MOUSE|nr:unnamed protein product [Mus musculus]
MTTLLPPFLSSLTSVRGQHCSKCLCGVVGYWRCQLLCLPHLLVSDSECWQREAYCLPLPQYTGETCLQAQSRAESVQSAVPQASGYASGTGAYRDQAKGTGGPQLPGHYSYHIHICAKNWPSLYSVEWIWC